MRRALQQDELHCVVIAADATGRVEDKVVRLARVVGVEERALAAGIVGRAPHKGLGEE